MTCSSRQRSSHRLVALGAVAAAAPAALAGPTYFATEGSTLFRVTDGSVETFQLDRALNALSFDADGRLFGTAKTDSNSDGAYELVEIVDPFGAGIAGVVRGDFLSGDTSSLTVQGRSFSGFDKTNGQLIDINTAGMTMSIDGMLSGGAADTPGSSAYDPVTGTVYGIKGDDLFRLDANGGGYDLTTIATLTGGVEGKIGGEWFDGQYHHAINDGEFFRVYTVDLQTGALTLVTSWETDGRGSAGFAVAVPAPATLALVPALGGLALARRRR